MPDKSQTNPPQYAGGNLRILSSIDHNGQWLTTQGFSHWMELA